MTENTEDVGAFEAAGEALAAICEAVSAASCPYLRQVGICASGCWEEPRCLDADVSTESMTRNVAALVVHLEVDGFSGLAEQVERALLEYRKDGEPGADSE